MSVFMGIYGFKPLKRIGPCYKRLKCMKYSKNQWSPKSKKLYFILASCLGFH